MSSLGPFYECCACAGEICFPETDLQVYNDEPWCENCWDDHQPDPELDWSELDSFVSKETKRIKELEEQVAQLSEVKT